MMRHVIKRFPHISQSFCSLCLNVQIFYFISGKMIWLGGMYNATQIGWMWVSSNRKLSEKNSAWSPNYPTMEGNCLVGLIEGPMENQRTYLGNNYCNVEQPYVCQLF
ncbi:unnamed protein product [Meganyctiphanes norvegica]|uniref:C-type lectin domain-containing protein n=1 Tax=Meganyctiphanes norvegica TaxID=48144 RepID=A0AAV2Q9M5_MEGNR